jgi:hypothetical protein
LDDDPALVRHRPPGPAIDPAGLRFMAKRAQGQITEIDASHLSLISHAGTVAQVIERAAR